MVLKIFGFSFLFYTALIASDCPTDTFMRSQFCKSVAAKGDSELVNLYIMLNPLDSSGAYTSFDDAKGWSKILFEKYDFFNCANSRVSPPPDSEIRWDYQLLSTTKAQAVSILKEPFIAQVSLMEQPPGCNDYSCPGPKYEGITCDSLFIKPSDSYFSISISLTRLWQNPPCYHEPRGGKACPELEDVPANRILLRQWTTELFSKFDLRTSQDSTKFVVTPDESELYWDYGPFKATSATIFDLIKETYVYKIKVWDRRNIPTPAKVHPVSEIKSKGRYDFYYLNGRKVQGKIELDSKAGAIKRNKFTK